jgi:hypothetical protein
MAPIVCIGPGNRYSRHEGSGEATHIIESDRSLDVEEVEMLRVTPNSLLADAEP